MLKYLNNNYVCLMCAFFQIPKDGNCLFRAMWEQFNFEDDRESTGPEMSKQGQIYTPLMLRRQVVMALARSMDVSTTKCMYVHTGIGTFIHVLVRSHTHIVRSYV